MPGTRSKTSTRKSIAQLAQLSAEADRRKFFTRHRGLIRKEFVEQLAELVVERVRVSTQEALHLAEAAILIARRLKRKDALALGLRAKANALYLSGDNRAAMEHNQQAFQLYESLGDWKEAARTLSTSIQPLILLGEYDQAFHAAERAREIFTRLDDPRRLARLEINVGNIYHRQDRFEESIAHYERAYEGLLPYKDVEGIGVVLSNMAVCLISLNDFPRALATYQRARAFCQKHNMPLLVAQADYNIAYLYYLRGEYSLAIEALYAARRACEATGDAYHLALCHLDLSDIYLELNLSEEAREMAHEGFLRFQKLGMGYEAAKTLANEATAYGQQGKTTQALERFVKAREIFVREDNLVWPWLIDLYQGLLLFQEGRYFEARRLCTSAAAFFDQSALSGKAVLAHLLLAQIAFQVDDLRGADQETRAAIAKLSGLQTPVLIYQAHFLEGEIARESGQRFPRGWTGWRELVRRIRDLREELNWYYHRIELEQLQPEAQSRQKLENLQEIAQSHEKELLRTLRELPAHERENATLEAPADFSLKKLQAALPQDTTLVEYFTAGEQLVAAIISEDSARIIPLTMLSRVTHLLQLLRFQVSKFRMGNVYVRRFEEALLRATESHLESLYSELIAPLRMLLQGTHVIFVPHGPLHFLPFHALKNGSEYLSDAFTISYAPSATVFSLCQQKATSNAPASLVLGIADERAPQILDEVRCVSSLLPHSSLHLGEYATSSLLREKGPESGLLHIATHGVYRQDNPMFSGIRLGDGYLNLYDLYQMKLNARLVTLSGCATGMNFVAAGDELLGLQRGLFCAGATTLLLSLWDVHDESTAQLMGHFYRRYIEGHSMAESLQHAMRELRQTRPHPFYWAPFVLVGKQKAPSKTGGASF